MTRSLSNLTIVMLATLAFGGAAVHGQTKPSSNCGVETWSTDQMAYVTVPCASGQEQTDQTAKAPANTPAAAKCGVETWSTDQMAYVGTPCPAGTTYENPGVTK